MSVPEYMLADGPGGDCNVIYRLQVPGGWLMWVTSVIELKAGNALCTQEFGAGSGACFVPDPKHEMEWNKEA